MTQAPERTELVFDYGREVVEYIRADLVPQWQPIETAPKDGAWVICLVGGDAIEGVMRNGRWNYISLNSHGCGCCGDDDPEPTHWMPLPAPPSP
jgi:hypothetical protein